MLLVVLSSALAAAANPTLTPYAQYRSAIAQHRCAGSFSVAAAISATVAVDIYFDTADVALAVTSATGAFSGINITVPTTAVPGTHWVTAVARGTTGKSAQAAFSVQTNWSQFRYSPLHRGRNPYENVLTTTNVGSIDVDWTFTPPRRSPHRQQCQAVWSTSSGGRLPPRHQRDHRCPGLEIQDRQRHRDLFSGRVVGNTVYRFDR